MSINSGMSSQLLQKKREHKLQLHKNTKYDNSKILKKRKDQWCFTEQHTTPTWLETQYGCKTPKSLITEFKGQQK